MVDHEEEEIIQVKAHEETLKRISSQTAEKVRNSREH